MNGLVVVRALYQEGREEKGPYRQEVIAFAIAIAQVSVIAAARQIQDALALSINILPSLDVCVRGPFSDQTEALTALSVS